MDNFKTNEEIEGNKTKRSIPRNKSELFLCKNPGNNKNNKNGTIINNNSNDNDNNNMNNNNC